MVDQLSAKWLELAESLGIVDLPSIRSLRDRGVTFSRAFCSNPVCSPSRATIATGMSSRGHGVLENGYTLDDSVPTFMGQLASCGWSTGLSGKLHLTPHYAGLYPPADRYGFAEAHITEDPRGGEWLDWIRENSPESFEDALATCWSPEIPGFASYGSDGEDLSVRIKQIRNAYRWDSESFPESTDEAYLLPFPEAISQTAWITDHAEQTLRRIPADQPLFLQVSYVQPHGPSCPPQEYLDRVREDLIPPPLPAEWRNESPPAPYFERLMDPASTREKKKRVDPSHKRRLFFADLAHLDDRVGDLLKTLESTRDPESTMIVFLADHGELLFDHGFLGKAERHYDACIRVPLTLVHPDLHPGTTRYEFVQLEDIAPTILDAAGVDEPHHTTRSPYLAASADELRMMSGRSLLALCSEDGTDWHRNCAYVESYNATRSIDPGDWARTVRTARYRYTYYPHASGEQLFDLVRDPDEQVNLARNPDARDTLVRLRALLLEHVILQDHPKSPRSLSELGVH